MSDMAVFVCVRAHVSHISGHIPPNSGGPDTPSTSNMTKPRVNPPRGATVAVMVVGGVVQLLDWVVIRHCQSAITITTIIAYSSG